MKCPYGPNASCAECEDTSQVCHPDHGRETADILNRINRLEERVQELEEKESQREHDKHQIEIAIDESETGGC